MPVQLAVNDLLEAKVYCKCQGQWSINTLHYVVTSVVGVALFDANVLVDLIASMNAEFKDCMSSEASFEGMSLQRIFPTRNTAVISNAGAGPGVTVGDVLPRQVAGLIRKKTTTATRHGRGRVYVPFPPESANNATGFPTAGHQATLLALANKLDDPLAVTVGADTTTITPIILNRELGTGIAIDSCEVASTWATCRRRSDVRGADRAPF